MNISQKGFSVLELAISLVISSIIYVSFLGYFVNMSKGDLEKETNAKIQEIEAALNKYVQTNGYLPCPASREDALTSSNLGVSTDCTLGSATGTTDVTNASTTIRIGAVPVATLGVDRNYIFDGWKNRFTYIVVKSLATTSSSFKSYAASGTGPIIIQDKNANQTNVSNDVSYVLISHGMKGYGAYNIDGTVIKACGAALESQNCNDDYTFVDSDYFPTENTSYFDDVLKWKTRSNLIKSSGLAIALQ